MRLFLGLPLPLDFAEALARTARATGIANARWIPAENIHLTLVFLGSVAEERLPAIVHELDHIDPPPLRLRVTNFGTFPRAGVFFAEVEPAPVLLQLQTQLVAAMTRCGFPQDDRPYHPHITLARVRGTVRLSSRQVAIPLSAARSFDVNCVNLYQSRTLSEGARYEVLAQRPARTC